MSRQDTALVQASNDAGAIWKAELYREGNLANFGKALAGTGLTPSRFAWQAHMAVQRNPKLLDAPRLQLWQGVFAAAECGLSLQPHMQHFHLIPFAGKNPTVSPVVGYQGLAFLAAKSSAGLIEPPVIVWQRDVDEHRFKYREGSKRTAELDPVVRDPKRPRGILRYVIGTFVSPTGTRIFKVMERDEFLERRERSSGYQAFIKGWRKSSPWDIQNSADGSTEIGDWLAMCQKTVIRDLAKVLPKSTDHWGERAAKAEAVEATVDASEKDSVDLGDVLDVSVGVEAEKTGVERLKQQVGLRAPEADYVDVEPTDEQLRQEREARAKKSRGDA